MRNSRRAEMRQSFFRVPQLVLHIDHSILGTKGRRLIRPHLSPSRMGESSPCPRMICKRCHTYHICCHRHSRLYYWVFVAGSPVGNCICSSVAKLYLLMIGQFSFTVRRSSLPYLRYLDSFSYVLNNRFNLYGGASLDSVTTT